jgi:hypothetical protein
MGRTCNAALARWRVLQEAYASFATQALAPRLAHAPVCRWRDLVLADVRGVPFLPAPTGIASRARP